jgi:anti-anti-sigma factor
MEQAGSDPGDEAAGRPPFTVSPGTVGSTTVLTLSGELDHDSADLLRDAFDQALADGATRILVDCSELRFCDSTGLNTLLRARLATEEAGVTLDVAGLRAAVARLFEITGADGVFTTFPTIGEALAQD